MGKPCAGKPHARFDEEKEERIKILSSDLLYYEGRDCPQDEELVRERYLREEGAKRCIIEQVGVPVGYIQYYELEEDERTEYGYDMDGTIIFGTDQFVGETSLWGTGIGQRIVTAMVGYLIDSKGAQKIVMDPQAKNLRGIACYEKCGFVKKHLLKAHELHEGIMEDSWLMEYTK